MTIQILAGAGLTAILTLHGWTLRRVSRLSEDVAVIRQELTPTGQPALAATVGGHEIRISLNERDIVNLKEALA